ncbi:MAG: hypothetical protein ACJ763_10205 [Bdellovibrionia bacterium]
MGTSNTKALQRKARGLASKAGPNVASGAKGSRAVDRSISAVGRRKKIQGSRATPSVSASGKSSRGLSASVPARVSHAKRRAS